MSSRDQWMLDNSQRQENSRNKKQKKRGKKDKAKNDGERTETVGDGKAPRKKPALKKRKYDPFANPPDLEMAETYGKAFRVRIPEKARDIEQQKKIIKRLCPVSGLDPEGKLFPLCGNMFKLNFLGSGFILLFSLLKGLVGLLALLCLFALPKLIRNINGEFCLSTLESANSGSSSSSSGGSTTRIIENELAMRYLQGLDPSNPISDENDYNRRFFEINPSRWCKSTWITSHSSANYGLNVDTASRGWYSFFIIVGVGLVIAYYNVFVEDKHEALDAMNDVPDDFTLIVRGLPEDEPASEIHRKFETYGAGAKSNVQLKVQKVTLAYHMEDFIKIQGQLHKLKKDLLKQFSLETMNIKAGEDIDKTKLSKTYKKMEAKVKAVQELLHKEEEALMSLSKKKSSKGIAFITFDTKRQMKEVKKYWGSSHGFLARACSSKSKTKYSTTDKNGKLRMHEIWVSVAPLPSDILWTNLGLDPWLLFKRRVLTFFLSGVILGVCFSTIIGFKSIQGSMRRQQLEDREQGKTTSNVGFQLVSFLISMIISVINQVLGISLKILTRLERHDSTTDLNRSMVAKTTVVQFLNTCILISFVHMFLVEPNFQIWASGGILTDAMFVMLSDIYMAPLYAMLNPFFFMSLWKQKSLRDKLKDGNYKGHMTQAEANKVFEGRPFNAASIYNKMLKIWFQSIFFLPILPISSMISCLALILFYWTTKYRLLRRAARPISINYQITATSIFMLRFSPLVLGVSFMIFDLMIRLTVEGFSMTMLVFGIFFLILPLQKPFEWMFKCMCFGTNKVEGNRDVSYENFRYKFLTEYDRANPVTKRLGMIDYANYMRDRLKKRAEKKEQVNPEQEQLDMFNMMQMGMGGGMDPYAGGGGFDYGMGGGMAMNPYGGMDPYGGGYGGGYGGMYGGGGYDPYGGMMGGGYGSYGGMDPYGAVDPYSGMFGGGGGGYSNAGASQFDYYGAMNHHGVTHMNSGPMPNMGQINSGPQPSGPTPIPEVPESVPTPTMANPIQPSQSHGQMQPQQMPMQINNSGFASPQPMMGQPIQGQPMQMQPQYVQIQPMQMQGQPMMMAQPQLQYHPQSAPVYQPMQGQPMQQQPNPNDPFASVFGNGGNSNGYNYNPQQYGGY